MRQRTTEPTTGRLRYLIPLLAGLVGCQEAPPTHDIGVADLKSDQATVLLRDGQLTVYVTPETGACPRFHSDVRATLDGAPITIVPGSSYGLSWDDPGCNSAGAKASGLAPSPSSPSSTIEFNDGHAQATIQLALLAPRTLTLSSSTGRAGDEIAAHSSLESDSFLDNSISLIWHPADPSLPQESVGADNSVTVSGAEIEILGQPSSLGPGTLEVTATVAALVSECSGLASCSSQITFTTKVPFTFEPLSPS